MVLANYGADLVRWFCAVTEEDLCGQNVVRFALLRNYVHHCTAWLAREPSTPTCTVTRNHLVGG